MQVRDVLHSKDVTISELEGQLRSHEDKVTHAERKVQVMHGKHLILEDEIKSLKIELTQRLQEQQQDAD